MDDPEVVIERVEVGTVSVGLRVGEGAGLIGLDREDSDGRLLVAAVQGTV